MYQIKNYDHVYKFSEHKSSQGGVGLLVKKCLKSDKQCVLEQDDIDAVYTIVIINNKRYMLGSVYISPNSPKVFKKFALQLGGVLRVKSIWNLAGIIVTGDFNGTGRQEIGVIKKITNQVKSLLS